jgi:hypothetical protein
MLISLVFRTVRSHRMRMHKRQRAAVGVMLELRGGRGR